MSLVPLIVGSIFIAVGINIVLGFIRFKIEATQVVGRVKAIEKFRSITRTSNNSRSTATMFNTLAEYSYRGEKRLVKSIASNEIRHQLNQKLKVLVVETDEGQIQARIDDSMYIVFGGLFAIIGLISVAVYSYAPETSLQLSLLLPIALTLLGYVGYIVLKKFKVPMSSGEDTQTPRENSVLIETRKDYLAEMTSNSFLGKVIAFVFMSVGFGLIYWGNVFLSESQFVEGEFQALFSDIEGLIIKIKDGLLESKWQKPLIVIGMGSFFVLASIHSFIYTARKSARLTRF